MNYQRSVSYALLCKYVCAHTAKQGALSTDRTIE